MLYSRFGYSERRVFKVGQVVFSYAVSLFVFAKSRFFQAVYYVHLTIDRCNRLFNLFVALEINFATGDIAFYFLSVAAPEKQVYAKAAQTKYKNIYNNENKHKAAICTHRFRGASDYQFCYQNAAKSEKSRGIEIQNRLKDNRYPEKISIVTASVVKFPHKARDLHLTQKAVFQLAIIFQLCKTQVDI
jgi:hypothetical protein